MRHVLWALLLTPLLSDEYALDESYPSDESYPPDESYPSDESYPCRLAYAHPPHAHPPRVHPRLLARYVYASPLVCKMMLSIHHHLEHEGANATRLTLGSAAGSPNYHAVLARLLTLSATLDWMASLSERALQLLLLLAQQIHPVLPRLWANHVPKLLQYLRSCAPQLCDAVKPGAGGGGGDGGAAGGVGSGGGRVGEEWSQLCVHFTGDSLDAIAATEGGHEWIRALGHEALSQLGSPQLPARLKACVLSHLGPLLARSPPNAILPHALPAMLHAVAASDHSAEAELANEFETGGARLGCAIGMGAASSRHFDAVVDALSHKLRELSGPPPDNVADFLFAQVSSLITEQRPQHAIETDTATALLAIGHATAGAPAAALGARATLVLTTIIAASKSARGDALRGCAARALELIAKVICSASAAQYDTPDSSGVRVSPPAAQTRDEAVDMLLRFLAASLRGAYDHQMQLTAARRLQLPALHACALLVSLPPRPPARICAQMVQSTLQLMQADVLAAKAPPEPSATPDGQGVGGGPVDLAAVAEETFRHRQLMSVIHAVFSSLVAMPGPPPTGLFPLLAAVLPLALSSYSLLRFRAMEAASRLLQSQLRMLKEGGGMPEATLDTPASEAFGGVPGKTSMLAAWHSFAAGKVNRALAASSPGRASSAEPPAADPIDVSAEGGASEPPADPFAAAIGACTGLVLPRCSDAEARIRRPACLAAHGLLKLAVEARCRGHDGLAQPDVRRAAIEEALAEAGRVLETCANGSELEQRVEAQRALVPCVLALLPPAGIDALARSLIGGLDAEWSGAAAACVALNGLLPHANNAGAADFVSSVLVSLLDVLPRIESQLVTNGALTVGASLAAADLDAVVRTLVSQPAPVGSAAVSLTQRLAREPALLERLIRALTASIADDDAAPPALPTCDASLRANSATALLQVICEEEECHRYLLDKHRPAMLAALVLRMGAVRSAGGKPEQTVCNATLALLEAMPEVNDAPATEGAAALGDDGEASIIGEDTPLPPAALVSVLRTAKLDALLHARSLARITLTPAAMRREPPEPYALFERLHPYVGVQSAPVRETVLAAIAELCVAARVDATFTQQAVHLLLRALVDDAPPVRIQALVGLRHLGSSGALKQHLTSELFETALSTLAATLAEPNVDVGLAAFAALVPALAAANTASVATLLAQLSEHSRAAVENDEGGARLRAAGFETFAWLSRAAAEPAQSAESRAAFGEHAHALLPLLLLHGSHDDAPLQRASHAALRALEPWFGLRESVLPDGAPGAQPHAHALAGGEWLDAMAGVLTRAQPARLPRYLTCCAKRAAGSTDDHVRCQAVRLTGGLLTRTAGWDLGEDGGELRAHATQQLVAALGDADVDVRREAARALGSVGGSL